MIKQFKEGQFWFMESSDTKVLCWENLKKRDDDSITATATIPASERTGVALPTAKQLLDDMHTYLYARPRTPGKSIAGYLLGMPVYVNSLATTTKHSLVRVGRHCKKRKRWTVQQCFSMWKNIKELQLRASDFDGSLKA